MIFKEIVLKVTSICNLNCSYCYVFNQGDNSFEKEPNVFEKELIEPLAHRIESYCIRNSIDEFLIIFHGGEPLLAGKSFYKYFVQVFSKIIKSTKINYGLQTNGTLLTDDWCILLNNLNIQVGISIDGTEKASQHRVYKSNNKLAYNEIVRGIKTLRKKDNNIRVLSVINIEEEPKLLYNYYKKNKIAFLDLLLPDTTYEKCKDIGSYGKWLSKMFDLWYVDGENKPEIRMFFLIQNLIMGNTNHGNEVFGRRENTTLNIKTNGNIAAVDTLKVCGNGFTKTPFNILENEFEDCYNTNLLKHYYYAHQDLYLCPKCQNCIVKDICGGGQLAHRYSSKNGFNNPTVYCKDIIFLTVHIQNRMVDTIKELKDYGVEYLTTGEFN